MKESRKFYNRGVKNFHKGNLEKAIANLDIAISYDMKNSAALNLRGMIYYLKGQGQKAITSWKINIDFNSDEIARGYIDAYVNEDGINEYRYKQALEMIEKIEIKSAIESLEAASGSDYNIINVRNALAYCYIKKRNFDLAKNQIELVLDKDRNNAVAKGNLETIKKETGSLNFNKQKIMIVMSVVVVLIGGVSLMKNSELGNKNLATIPKEDVQDEVVDETEDKKVDKIDKESKEDELAEDKDTESDNIVVGSVKELKNAISNSDFKWIDKNLVGIEKEDLSKEDGKVLKEAKIFMSTKGIDEMYSKGKTSIKAKAFESGKETLLMAKKYSKESYLDQHITYMLAGAFEGLEDNKNANLYYEEYISSEYKGEDKTYTEEVLYKLAILNKENDKAKSKKYASKLANNFNDSMYNNDKIKDILKN